MKLTVQECKLWSRGHFADHDRYSKFMPVGRGKNLSRKVALERKNHLIRSIDVTVSMIGIWLF